MTDYDILANSLVLAGCLAKRKRTIYRRVKKRLDMEQFRHFGSICEGGSWNGKSGAEAVFVYATKSQRATRQSQRLRLCRATVAHVCRATKLRTRATKSRDKIDKIARVTSVCMWLLCASVCACVDSLSRNTAEQWRPLTMRWNTSSVKWTLFHSIDLDH